MRYWPGIWGVIAFATVTLASDSTLQTNDTIWANGPGNGFKADTWNVGLSAGGAVGVRTLGAHAEHDLVVGGLSGGWVFTDLLCQDHWWRGNWELRGDLYGGEQIDPSRYLVGLTTGFRYHIATCTRFVPFAQFGAGVAATDIKEPDLSTIFEFNLMIGGGVNYFITDDVALGVDYRFFHLSNSGLGRPNMGVNSHMFLASVAWWF